VSGTETLEFMANLQRRHSSVVQIGGQTS